jgi:hypothetical protein
MHRNALIIILLIAGGVAIGQDAETVLSAPQNWKSEIIPFPINFAPDIDYVGFEDLRFCPGWSDSTKQDFWSYTFVWYIEKAAVSTEASLTEAFNLYYDGLMGVDRQVESDSIGTNKLDKTLCLFVKTAEGFSGKMRVYDNFFSKDYMTLNIKVRESFCPKMNKQIIFCDISPNAFDHEVWGMFENVELKKGACESEVQIEVEIEREIEMEPSPIRAQGLEDRRRKTEVISSTLHLSNHSQTFTP